MRIRFSTSLRISSVNARELEDARALLPSHAPAWADTRDALCSASSSAKYCSLPVSEASQSCEPCSPLDAIRKCAYPVDSEPVQLVVSRASQVAAKSQQRPEGRHRSARSVDIIVALWPAGGDQVRPARRFVREAALELRQGLRKIGARYEKYTTHGEGSESTG